MSEHEHEWEISIGGNFPNLEADAICARGRDLECISRLSEEEVERRLNAHAALEAKLSKMKGLDIQISDGDVWLHFPNAAISIEGICRFGAPGPIVKKNLRTWRDKALAGGDE